MVTIVTSIMGTLVGKHHISEFSVVVSTPNTQLVLSNYLISGTHTSKEHMVSIIRGESLQYFPYPFTLMGVVG